MNNIMDKLKTFFLSIRKPVWAFIVFVFFMGLWISGPDQAESKAEVHDLSGETQAEFWTCAMHPHIRLNEPGQCPICFMDLIPVESSGDGLGPRELKMSETAMAIAGITTVPVRRGIARRDIRLSGKVKYDETLMKHITAWFPGRLEHLFVDYTGISVRQGDHMVEIYSPSLYAAQEEYLQALSMAKRQTAIAGRSAEVMLGSAREKLRLLGLTMDQISEIEQRGTPSDRMEIYSPLSGVVIHKQAVEGMYVKTGTKIYTVADLSRVWIILDAYESDLPWLAYGQEVSLKLEALPGEMFSGRISFIDPVLDPKTRTVKVRLNISNLDGKLKPNMFVNATVHSQVDAQGLVVNPYMSGKWVARMHPEIVRESPGDCDICGMSLVKAEDMGIVSGSADSKRPLLVPASAVLLTGKRAVIYIMVPDREEPTFESREIIIGARAGDEYIVVSGLKEGEMVVKKGNFKLDSAMQIAAKPSMMNPEGGVAMTGHAGHGDMGESAPKTSPAEQPAQNPSTQSQKLLPVNEQFRVTLNQIFKSYFEAHSALAGDDRKTAVKALSTLNKTTAAATGKKSGLKTQAKPEWAKLREMLLNDLKHLKHWTSIKAVRKGFEALSATVIKLEQTFGHSGDKYYYKVFCPMINENKGAYWLQLSATVKNPFYGSKMLDCGEISKLSSGHTAGMEGGK